MRRERSVRLVIGTALAAGALAGATASAEAPLAIDSARITIAGTSNIHAYTASTSEVRVTRVQLSTPASPEFWDNVLKPGAIEAFDVAIPAATLTSPREGLDKKMHKALQVEKFPDIQFRLVRLGAETGAVKAVGLLKIAGVEREVSFDVRTERRGPALVVSGQLPLLMTDYGIKPPSAMLGMLKTDPKVTIGFEVALTTTGHVTTAQ